MPDAPDIPTDPQRYHIEGDHRSEASGPLDAVSAASRGDSFGTDAGLVAGDADDPVLVAGVGYPLLGDMALGTVVAYEVAAWDLPGVAVADCSHTPVAAYQTITETDYEAVLVVGAEKPDGEINDGQPAEHPGRIHEYGPGAVDVPDDRIADLVGQTAMGLNTLENVVIVTKALGAFPDRTRVIGVEPAYDSWGMTVEEFTEPVEAAYDEVLDLTLSFLEESLAAAEGVDVDVAAAVADADDGVHRESG
jgi:Ni,Fe-hydrogenase maturation factor